MSTPRTVIVTGAAAGIGEAVARRLGRDPATRLVLIDRDAARLHESIDAADPGLSGRCEAHALDIADREAVTTLFDGFLKGGREVHVLVNCAGVSDENQPDDIDTFRHVIDINVLGTFQVTALCLPLMRRGARIIHMASILARAGKVRNTGYCASKHAIVGMTKALALDLAPEHITVNAVLPAWVDTPMLVRELMAQARAVGQDETQARRNAVRRLPMRRLVQSDEVASMVEWLAGPEAGAVTAQSLVIDGGVGMGM